MENLIKGFKCEELESRLEFASWKQFEKEVVDFIKEKIP
jgi:hypothetical protein